MIRALTAVVLAVGLTACGDRPAEPAPAASAEAAAQSAVEGAPVSAADKLSATGFGPLRIGMSRAEVEAAMGPDANPGAVGGPDPERCDQFRPERAPEGLLVMMQQGVLASVWLTGRATAETDRGLNIGDTAAEVRRVHGDAVQARPHAYQSPPAEYLTVWTTAEREGPSARGVTFEIGQDGRVRSIAGGGPSILAVEGCV